MEILTYESREDWLLARRGKITGSRVKDIISKRGNVRKIGFYELIAERLATIPDEEDPMDRGTRLEEEALARFSKETGKKLNTDLVMWVREDIPSIAVSPDGFIGKTEGVETKCLSSARHVEAYITKHVPDEYWYQAIQYFVVNDSLKKLYFVFYDPRMPSIEFFYIEIKREDVQQEVDETLEYEKSILAEVNDIVNELTF